MVASWVTFTTESCEQKSEVRGNGDVLGERRESRCASQDDDGYGPQR